MIKFKYSDFSDYRNYEFHFDNKPLYGKYYLYMTIYFDILNQPNNICETAFSIENNKIVWSSNSVALFMSKEVKLFCDYFMNKLFNLKVFI